MGVTPIAEGRRYGAPVPIAREHRTEDFESGKQPLDDWLRAHALENEGKASRTFVIGDARGVHAYYTLATGSVSRTSELPRALKNNMPNPVPVMILARLAVDRRHAGQGLGAAMLKEALTRTLRVSEQAGLRALIVHAIDDEAVNFYAKYGFQLLPGESRTLYLTIETIASSLA